MSQAWKFQVGSAFANLDQAMQACTHLGVGAHPDDLEVMCGHGILESFDSLTQNFFGVTCTTGASSARAGEFASLSDSEMAEVRAQEQFQSAEQGRYCGVVLLQFASADIKAQWNEKLLDEFRDILQKTQAQVIYTHNPLDKHLTHVSVVAHLVEALRSLQWKPKKLYGCEVWRGLDWLPESEKAVLPISEPERIKALIECHRSQVASGKRYGVAVKGRMAANATFYEARSLDQNSHQIFALDLLPLLQNPALTLSEFGRQKVELLAQQVRTSLTPFAGGE